MSNSTSVSSRRDGAGQAPSPSSNVVVVASVRARGGCEDALAQASAELTPQAREQSGCLEFRTYRGEDVPGLILFYEVYEDDQALTAHKEANFLKEWFEKIEPLTAGPVEVSRLSEVA